MSRKYPIRVAVVIPKYGLIGGAEGFVFNLTERLAQRDDFDVHVIANQWRQGEASITFHKVPRIRFPRWLQPISFAYFVQKTIQEYKFAEFHLIGKGVFSSEMKKTLEKEVVFLPLLTGAILPASVLRFSLLNIPAALSI